RDCKKERSRLDDREASPPYSGRFPNVSKPGGCGPRDGFLSLAQSDCSVHARCHRTKEAFSENRRDCEIVGANFFEYCPNLLVLIVMSILLFSLCALGFRKKLA